MRFHCCEPQRLEVIQRAKRRQRQSASWRCATHLEPVLALRQRTLFVRLLQPGFSLGTEQLLIDGGERIPQVAIEWAARLPTTCRPAWIRRWWTASTTWPAPW